MTGMRIMATIAAVGAIVGVGAAAGSQNWSTTLSGYEEVLPQSTPAGGAFKATISPDESSVSWEMTFEASTTTQSHLHFGQVGVNGLSAFSCARTSATAQSGRRRARPTAARSVVRGRQPTWSDLPPRVFPRVSSPS